MSKSLVLCLFAPLLTVSAKDVGGLLADGRAPGGELPASDAGPSRSRHWKTWAAETETTLNEHIALEMQASVQYRALFAWASRDYVNLKHSAAYFAKAATEEFDHAYQLMAYQTRRGGKVELKALDAPVHEFDATNDHSDARVAFESALAMEKKVYDSLLNLHATCNKHGDPSCQDFIDGFLTEQIDAIDEIARYVADLDRVGPSGHAVWEWDHEFEA